MQPRALIMLVLAITAVLAAFGLHANMAPFQPLAAKFVFAGMVICGLLCLVMVPIVNRRAKLDNRFNGRLRDLGIHPISVDVRD